MTAIQVNYQNLMEQKRHNAEMERIQDYETRRKYDPMVGTETQRAEASKQEALTNWAKYKQSGLTIESQVFSNYAKGAADLFKSIMNGVSAIGGLFK